MIQKLFHIAEMANPMGRPWSQVVDKHFDALAEERAFVRVFSPERIRLLLGIVNVADSLASDATEYVAASIIRDLVDELNRGFGDE